VTLPARPSNVRWNAIIYTKKMLFGSAQIPLLTCLHRSPAVMHASWPD
jgi:hypothetical protein